MRESAGEAGMPGKQGNGHSCPGESPRQRSAVAFADPYSSTPWMRASSSASLSAISLAFLK